ncbi:unnamed protein product [Rotaria sp. Silwood2]|nr:unnamed protein product [Rotaria sp. Silwood2]CAF3530603.1 unnamed protein product [Rotaria sp. Silwood2]CAF4572056.1 unnamed protein product [Rotaria sp. Silwood2]CAF4572910.1 unnamed protein product [Rotaria sp. Silwood2]CAF4766832.1 unnamed protein product [Rotaria sp. Silwood2]
MFSLRHDECLFSVLPQLFAIEKIDSHRRIPAFLCSRFIRSVISFELDEDCILPTLVNNDDLFFPQSSHLTHIRITLRYFNDCIHLLNQLGAQLHSFGVSFTHTNIRQYRTISRIASISCPYLKELTITSYRNIPYYDPFVVPLLQRLTTIEYLTLLLAVGVEKFVPRHFIDGYGLQRDIISYMPHLRQFHFHIRSIVAYASHIDIDTIRQSFVHQEQSVDCVLDYFNNSCGQCQIFSLPFIGTRLDFISNRFPLFDENKNTFSNVTTILLFDDVKPFEYNFFRLVSRALPHLKSLEVFNRLEQEEKTMITTNLIEFPHLATLILDDIHMDYTKQFLCRTHLPCLVELLIHYEPLSTIIAQHPEEARNNCSKIEFLYFVDVSTDPTDPLLNFFPTLHCKISKST